MTRPSVVVLAAGSGTRLGLGPKAHVVLSGETFLSRIIATVRQAGLSDIVVVASGDDRVMASACDELSTRLAINPEPSLGMSSSVLVGLSSLAGGSAVIFPVDVPLVRPETVRLIASALAEGGDVVAHPVYEGERGHPIALGAIVVSRLAHALHVPLRDALIAVGGTPVDVPCSDPGVVTGINTPADLEAAQRRTGRP